MHEAGRKDKLYVASLSGGKDSTAMVLRLVEEQRPLDLVLFCDTGLEFPQMYDHVRKGGAGNYCSGSVAESGA